MTRLSLRARVFLFFALLAAGSAVIVGLAIWFGAGRAAQGGDGYIIAALISVLGVTGLVAGIWMLFDENVAKPIERLAADLRARAVSNVEAELDAQSARYLGDLAPAAQALNQRAAGSADATAMATAMLSQEKEQLTQLLSLIPVAIIVVSRDFRIILYDQQASEVLSGIAPPRLNASLFDYFQQASVEQAYDTLQRTGQVEHRLAEVDAGKTHAARLSQIGDSDALFLIIEHHGSDAQPVDLVYDFALMEQAPAQNLLDTPLSQLDFTVFDTETTGLDNTRHHLLQIGAVRVLRGRIVEGEEFDRLINPGVPIPASSTKIHHIDDAAVKDAQNAETVVGAFQTFAKDSVLVAHNAVFDMGFLRRVDPAWPHPVADTVLVSAMLYGMTEDHMLDALCERLNIDIPAHLRHTALGDAVATAQAFCTAIPMLEAKGIVTLRDFQTRALDFRRLQKLPEDGGGPDTE